MARYNQGLQKTVQKAYFGMPSILPEVLAVFVTSHFALKMPESKIHTIIKKLLWLKS